MKKKFYWIGGGLILIIILAIIIFQDDKTAGQLTTEVEKGKFEILVTTTGELQAKSSVDITGPTKLRNSRSLRIRDIKIQDLIPEGTVVDSGDYVATLDRSEAANNLKDMQDELEKMQSQYLKTQLDTTMQLRELRDQLVNLKFALEEKQIVLDQSKYEPPATIRQAKIELDKAERSYEQASKNYHLKKQQAEADMREAAINLDKAQRRVDEMNEVLSQFTVFAPQSGMVIYKKEWGGEKRKVGSNINPWDLTVATLPDLSSMSSKTYVNEIDISKVKSGQQVRIGIDAFPERKYTGEVIDVANIGEQLSNTDAKVFEVLIRIDQSDTIMRPAMTTSNQIITNTYEDVLFLPLEAVHSNDSLSYVYTKGGKKQILVLGPTNENHVIIEQGLEKGEEAYLTVPENAENYKYEGLELIPIIKQKELEEKKRKEEASNQGDNPWKTMQMGQKKRRNQQKQN